MFHGAGSTSICFARAKGGGRASCSRPRSMFESKRVCQASERLPMFHDIILMTSAITVVSQLSSSARKYSPAQREEAEGGLRQDPRRGGREAAQGDG